MVELYGIVFGCSDTLCQPQENTYWDKQEGRVASFMVVVRYDTEKKDFLSLLMDANVANGKGWQRAEVQYLVITL